MGKTIGIVICNYNKQDYILQCIQSVFESSTDDFDVYVVDNASTDDSVLLIREKYGDRVTLLVNEENLGGSGGFNTGLREVLKAEQKYEYVLLLDNDIVLDQYAIEELRSFLEENAAVGMVGSKAYFMDEPEKIWGYGGRIDFECYINRDFYKNCMDADGIPMILYCDYAAACSLLVRIDAIREVGIMPEENFIYWDDMEWGYRFNQAGYKVATYGKSKVWHKAGGRNAGNTFINYYMWRNRLHFFLKVLTDEKKEHFANTILTELFRMIYSCNLKGETNIIKSVMYAFDDAVHGVRGKADERKILPRFTIEDRLALAMKDADGCVASSVLICFDGNFEGLGNIIRNLKKIQSGFRIGISVTNDSLYQNAQEQYPECEVSIDYRPEMYEKHMIMCEHIFNLPVDADEDVYIDPWCNIIFRSEDFLYCKNFRQTKELFLLCKKDILLNSETKQY